MGIANVISLLGGIALFLFGMSLMGDGLKSVAGDKLELFLWNLSNTPIKGVLLGAVVTAVIQSSSATTVMVVGFVNSSMMSVYQSIGVIMGANIGTSATGWLLSLSQISGDDNIWISLFSTSTITAVVALIGIVLWMFSKSQTQRHVGGILLGFAVLMYGMNAMSDAVSPLKESETFQQFLTTFENPLLAILMGVVITSVLQSASAAVGILQALSATGTITFAAAVPIIMGIGIGASVPVLFSAIGAKRDGKRTAYTYLIINVIGTLVWSVIFYALNAIFDFSVMSSTVNSVEIALINSVYRILMVAVLFPFIKQLEKLSAILVKPSAEEASAPSGGKPAGDDALDEGFTNSLEDRFIPHPTLAVEQSTLAMRDMASRVKTNLYRATLIMREYSSEEYEEIQATEKIIDRYEDRIGAYLVKIMGREMTDAQNKRVSSFLHAISDFERIGDHAVNLSKAAQEMHDKSIKFSKSADDELDNVMCAVNEIVSTSFAAFSGFDISVAYRVEPLEELIDILCDKAKLHHIERIRAGECELVHGFVFNNIMTDLERIADHCSNIAVALIELEENISDTHEYLTNLRNAKTHSFQQYFDEYENKFGF
ncbi:MAG: Na/Pi cotransporter family protein [Firmicutes bacterium]|nr:Na/Pi cotransporter family protein [Bacillota bacterium]